MAVILENIAFASSFERGSSNCIGSNHQHNYSIRPMKYYYCCGYRLSVPWMAFSRLVTDLQEETPRGNLHLPHLLGPVEPPVSRLVQDVIYIYIHRRPWREQQDRRDRRWKRLGLLRAWLTWWGPMSYGQSVVASIFRYDHEMADELETLVECCVDHLFNLESSVDSRSTGEVGREDEEQLNGTNPIGLLCATSQHLN